VQLTIKRKLFGLTIAGLLFVASVSAAGYWGITSVEQTTAEVAATSSAIRNHLEAGTYNDMTRADMSAVFTAKSDEQQNKIEELSQHFKLLKDRISKARSFAVGATVQAVLDDEARVADQYQAAGNSLVESILHNPSAAAGQLGPYLQLYKDLQAKIENTSDQLEKGAKDAELGAKNEASSATRAMFLICGVSLLLLLVVATRITLSITRPLDSLSTSFKQMAEANDLTSRVDEDRADEIGELGKCLNIFVDKLNNILTQIARTAEQVAGASEEISSSAGQQAQGAETQKDQTSQVATAMQEMSSTVLQVSENSNKAAEASGQAAETAREGGAIVEETLGKMRVIAESVEATAKKMEGLGRSSDQIGRIAGVIDDIADQTNLLALNAAIEAARAGEQGRGFAVVADEVRKLAERTTTATKEIAQMIKTIQDETKTAVTAMEAGTQQVEEGVKSTARAGESLKQIIQMSEEVGEMITHIATAATQQSSASEEINKNLERIANLVKESAAGAQQSAKACQDLSGLALDLQNMVGNFKLSDSNSSHDGSSRSGRDLDSATPGAFGEKAPPRAFAAASL
jgi:methyl-accepting chemotaxis protein